MAVDTASRRASCIGFDFPSVHVWPVPDGTIGQPDRQHIAYKYPGISAAVAVAASADEAGARMQQMAQWQGRRMSFF